MFGWLECGERLCFAGAPRQPIGIVRKRVRQDVERVVAIQLGIARAIDLAHPAFA